MRKQKSSNGRGCLFLIVGTVLILALMALYIVVVGRITSSTIEARSGDVPTYAVMSAQVPCIVAAFILLECILVLQYLPSQEDYDKKASPGASVVRRNRLFGTRRLMNLVSLVLLLLVFVCGIVSVNIYRMVSVDGISTRFLFSTHSYSWDDVTACRVDCDSDKGLSLTLTMSDGEQFEILQNTISDNAAFASQYGSDSDASDKQTPVLAFAVDLCHQLDERGIRRSVSHRDRTIRFYKDTYPRQWEYVSELIGYEELRPAEDETVSETESVAE